ncbi:hypothetical protein [Aeromonas sp. HMWF014]|jgi:hypothetical protein|uniref:hypothetical protein n=1 Tax=Aeromonas sp. HMWF014 TaxID=2056850 RepID=UPI000D36E2A0|nr:hypothetical protein [Aeromonas sp. HMWF014]PTT50838.1 hypothetical protein DBR19_13025 [Aeromonas sp. HMWF014]
MLSLLLCTALWQSDASTLVDEAALAAPQPKEFPVTREQGGSPAVRERIADQMGNAFLARKPPVTVTLRQPDLRYPQDALLADSHQARSEVWDTELGLTFNE